MFRHSTKQNVRSQDSLRKAATQSLNKDRQILCGSIYDNTYGVELPSTSIEMLNNIVLPLTGCDSMVGGKKRNIHTMAMFESKGKSRLRLCFIQPEVSSATAVCSSSYSTNMSLARTNMVEMHNNPAPGAITVSKAKCQIAGRLCPYIVESSGLSGLVDWTYFNASKSRFLYISSVEGNIETLRMTRETILIYQSYAPKDCAIVYVSDMRGFKITASPEGSDESKEPNKSTSIFLYCDGTFKVVGTPHKSYKVCALFREAVIKAHSSSMSFTVLKSLVPLEESRS